MVKQNSRFFVKISKIYCFYLKKMVFFNCKQDRAYNIGGQEYVKNRFS